MKGCITFIAGGVVALLLAALFLFYGGLSYVEGVEDGTSSAASSSVALSSTSSSSTVQEKTIYPEGVRFFKEAGPVFNGRSFKVEDVLQDGFAIARTKSEGVSDLYLGTLPILQLSCK